ncbi:SDR family NAD(P)-dependent oxidoreductase [Aromatoleum toluclasticum]|uniref:SDR family NAD(P)-dependent oxidoreductase n=1 Tax=Aromatoleum toluclasticum TaxID=92003 RepID=UPI00035EFA4C|nr:SDR family NAD(P)-dependent oxidoreductase [Aromatoleum toluclasticum]
MKALEGKVALVTGAARGIGAGIARCLAAQGARVAILDLALADAEATAATLEAPAIGLEADAADERAMAAAADRVASAFGGIDIMVNNAGGAGSDVELLAMGMPFANVTQRGWDAQLQGNLRTAYAGCKAAIPHLQARGGGAIVNIASIAGLMAMPSVPAYAAAKAGVISLTRSLALELGPSLIRVNAICPGFLWTRAWEFLATLMKQSVPEYRDMAPREIFLDAVTRNTPMGREQTPEDIGHLVAFLGSNGAANITGQEIKVDGGITLNVMR